MKAAGHGKFFIRLIAAALAVLLLTAFAGVSASAAVNDDGFTVEKLSFRDVLRLYTLDKASFGSNAMETDENGVTNAAKRLAELFTFTVGLTYDGIGANSNFFGKDITDQMGQEPYNDAGLLATYDVDIAPYHSYATALPQGQTTGIRVYLTGYANAANGVEPVLHYVWQDHGTWFAVKDDNPYYQVSYNGESARSLSGTGLSITYTRAERGTEALQDWMDLTAAPDGNGVVHLDCSTLVVGQGTANVFGLTGDLARLQQEGSYSSSLLAVSDFVRGDTACQTGPLVYSRSVYEADTMRRVADGEALKEGVRYLFRVVYDEPLAVAKDASWSSVSMAVRSEVTGETATVSDFTWYGNEAYLTTNKYNPHTVEFSFTPSTQGYSMCTFTPVNLVGSDSALKAASFHARTETRMTSAAALTVSPAQPLTEAPAQLAAQENNSAPTSSSAEAAPAATPTPAVPVSATPTAPTASLDVLFSANENSPLTRGILAETLWILAGQPNSNVGIAFIDQLSDPNMGKAIVWASRAGILPSSGPVATDDPLTREEAAAILWRYAAARGKDINITSDLSGWSDGGTVSTDNTAAVTWALERGLISGYGDGYLRPAQNATCGETIAMIRTFQQQL